MKTTQFNTTLTEADSRRVKKDALNLGVKLSAYATQAFQAFLSKPVAVRKVHFHKRDKKLTGRNIAPQP